MNGFPKREIVEMVKAQYPAGTRVKLISINIYRNGRHEESRDYSSPKRAINAIKEIIRCAEYEF